MKSYIKFGFFLLLFIKTIEAQWTHLPGPYGGEIKQLITQGSKIYAVTQSAIYYSVDDCKNWIELTRKGTGPIIFNNNRMIGYLWDRSDPNLTGIKYSDDNGITWKRATLGVEGSVNSFAVIGNIILAATNYRLYKSNDNGDNWESIQEIPSWIKTLIVKDNKVFAGSWGNGIYISEDEGKTWRQSNIGLQNMYVTCLLLKDNTIYTGTAFNLYKSSDNGKTWERVFNDPDDLSKPRLYIQSMFLFKDKLYVGIAGKFLRHYDYAIDSWETHEVIGLNFCPTLDFNCMGSINDNLLIGSTYGILKSSNLGNSWDYSNTGISECRIGKLTISKGEFYAANVPNFLSVSKDLGNTWYNVSFGQYSDQLINSPNTPSLFLKDDYIFLGTPYNIIKSSDRGITWAMGDIFPFCLHKEKIYSIDGSTLFLSTNNGITWSSIPIQYNGSDNIKSLYSTGNYLFGSTNASGLFRSSDEGQTWEYVSKTFEDPYYTPSIPIINSVSYNGKYLFVATDNGFFKSSDFGSTWNKIKLINNPGWIDRYVKLYSKDNYVFVDLRFVQY